MYNFIKIFNKAALRTFLCLILVCILTGCSGTQIEKNASEKKSGKRSLALHQEMSAGSEAPDFSAKLNNGETFSLSDAKGQVILLNFWATWCSNCVKEMPAIEKLYEEYSDQITIIGVNVGEDKDTVDTFVEAKNYPFPIAYDTDSEISNLYPSAGIPYTVIIGKDGLVTETFLGAKDADSQYTKLRRALKEAYEANKTLY